MKKTISIITLAALLLGIAGTILDIFIDTGKSNIYEVQSFLWIMLGLFVAWLINKYIEDTKTARVFRVLFIISVISLTISVSIDPIGQYVGTGMVFFKVTLCAYALTVLTGLFSLFQKKS